MIGSKRFSPGNVGALFYARMYFIWYICGDTASQWRFVWYIAGLLFDMETPMTASPFVVVSSPGMHEMAGNVVSLLKAKHGLALPHHRTDFEKFANAEWLPQLPETVRRQHVFLFHPLQHPTPNDALMLMFLINDALKRASVDGITLVIPYMPYLRQDRKHKPRAPISARMVADLIESNTQVERIITVDMHADQEQGFFSIPVDNLSSMGLFAEHFKRCLDEGLSNVTVVAPDFGGAVRARRFAKKLGDLPVAIFEKRRPSANQSEVVSLIGEPVTGKTVVIYDDMIDTGGTIRGVVASLKSHGAKEVLVCATHGIFSGDSEEKFAAAGFPVFCTNSIPRDPEYDAKNSPWLAPVPMDELLSEAVYQASLVGGSVSNLNR